MTATAPVPVGPVIQITTEHSYAAFPFVARAADGTYVMSYRPGSNHWYGWLALRESEDGLVWSDSIVPPGMTPLQTMTSSPAGAYVWGSAGISAETAAQGGRVYIGVRRLHFTHGSVTVDGLRSYLIVRDPDGTLSPLIALPAGPGAPAIGFDLTGVLAAADGSLVISGALASTGRAYYYRSLDQGATWTACGDTAPTGGGCGEPTLLQIPDGRIFSFLRQDGGPNGEYDRIYWTSRGPDLTTGSWSTPVLATAPASGMPNAAVVGDEVWMAVRGYSDTNPLPANSRPLRIVVFSITPTGLVKVRDNIDPVPAITRTTMYGTFLDTDDDDIVLLLFSAEGPKGRYSAEAAVFAVPLVAIPIPGS